MRYRKGFKSLFLFNSDKDFKTGIIPFLSSNLDIVKSDTNFDFFINFVLLLGGISIE